ncbi:HAMP domain-containing histidine kinase [Marinobacter halodurans]|uniref:histidine kinase n=1 Tax=Marinobacter halodurans TaxID=2528979 RepID=A0ABY1ZI50_9GAMM|nr:HAMP domain-containing sensor histidine kinase [Marinobacter halodurans]TBW54275.1 HAMP domain-containing histidine kinase [Marinobacter halodurans]
MKWRFYWPLSWRIFFLVWFAMAMAVVLSNVAIQELARQERLQLEQRADLAKLAERAVVIRESGKPREAFRFLREQGERHRLRLLLVEGDNMRRERDGDGERPPHRRGDFFERQPFQPAVIDAPDGYRLIVWPQAGGDGWLDPRLFRSFELALTFLLITLACWWIARRISRPLRDVEATARSIAAGDGSLRVRDRIANRRDEIGALARAFNAMTDRLHALLERQQQLLRDISHDLRTPLARQRVAIELARDSMGDQDILDSIQRQNERLEAMTAQILTLHRVGQQDQSMAQEPVNMTRVLTEVLQGATDYAEQQRVDCHLEIAEDARNATVLGDEALIYRALDNVLQNALDHTPPDRTVMIHLMLTDRWLTCEIADQGPGVAEEDLPNLFEPFFRSDQARGGQGWGLGLAISHDIMRAHDGRISATNGPSGGLVVRLDWPVFT